MLSLDHVTLKVVDPDQYYLQMTELIGHQFTQTTPRQHFLMSALIERITQLLLQCYN